MRLNNLLNAVFLILAVAFFYGCSDEKQDAVLKLSETAMAFKAEGETRLLAVSASEKWDYFPSGESFEFTVNRNDDLLEITCPENTTGESRGATLIIKSGNVSMPVAILQNSYAPRSVFSITPTATEFEIPYEGGGITFAIENGGEWTASSDNEWFAAVADRDTGILTVTAPANEGEERLNAKITLNYYDAGVAKESVLQFTQLTVSDDLYHNLLGSWQMYASSWAKGNDVFDAGSYASCYWIEDIPGVSYVMNNLFYPGTALLVYLDKDNRQIHFSLYLTVGYTENYNLVLCSTNYMDMRYMTGGSAIGNISDDMQTIALTGIRDDAGWGLGIIGMEGEGAEMFGDLYYTTSADIEFRRAQDQNGAGFMESAPPLIRRGSAELVNHR